MSDISPPGFPSLEELSAWLPQYEIQGLVHAGQDSALYVARQSGLDRAVLIEVMPEPPESEVGELLERLRQRARSVHPGIAAVYDFDRLEPGLLYLVTEYVEGVWLQTLIDQKQVKPKTAFPLALQICEALQILHDHQVPHGMLNPATVLVTPENHVKLTSIGMADAGDGELSWLAPFQGSLTRDIHDLGFTLHWMFAREAPGHDGRLSRDLPPAFASVLRRCLGSDPTRQFERPDQVAAALKEALRSEQENADTPTSRSRMVIAPGAKQPPAAPVSKPSTATSTAAAASLPPRAQAPGSLQPLVRHREGPTFWQRVDAFVWRAFSTGLHLFISLVSIGSLILLILFKDRIVFEDSSAPAMATIEEMEAEVEKPLPAAVLGGLPPPEMLSTAPSQPVGNPITLPANPTPAPVPTVDPLADLKAQYIAAVQEAANHALSTVKLDDLPHLQRELQLLQSGGDIPAVDEANLPGMLKALRQRYREARAGLVR